MSYLFTRKQTDGEVLVSVKEEGKKKAKEIARITHLSEVLFNRSMLQYINLFF